jgi:hypothetical protein
MTMDNLNEDRSPSGAHISEDRRMIGLEATWEIEALNATIRELCEDLLPRDEQGAPLRLRVRGLTSRINDLVGVAMSVLDEDDDTGNLSRRVHGAAAAGGAEGNRNAH